MGKYVKHKLQLNFDIFWKYEINKKKLDENGIDNDKLRFYLTLKTSFTREPYVDSALGK